MNEKKRTHASLLSDLASAVLDLYGMNVQNGAELTRELQGGSAVPDPAAMVPGAPAATAGLPEIPETPDFSRLFTSAGIPLDGPARPAPQPAARPALPPFSQLWKTADETIDWTEVFASPTPTDGLTSPEKWTQYREEAACVLHGDVAAYLRVLRTANPMGDLMPYVTALDVSAVSSDELRASFSARPDLMECDSRRYLCGMALRIARDLFAVLPVTSVTVRGCHNEAEVINVRFDRTELNKVRFAFIDPCDFVVQCGGEFPEAEA